MRPGPSARTRRCAFRPARGAWWLVVLALPCVIACGPNARQIRAEETVRLASHAITEVHASGGEAPPVAAALADAEQWLAHTEEAVDLWHAGAERSLAYETMAPCLARSLGEVREALTAAGRDVPASLESAEAAAAAVTEATCPSPQRSGDAAE